METRLEPKIQNTTELNIISENYLVKIRPPPSPSGKWGSGRSLYLSRKFLKCPAYLGHGSVVFRGGEMLEEERLK